MESTDMGHPFEGVVEGQLETGSILQSLYAKDPSPEKVNLLRGAYEAETGTPFVLPSVIKAREKLFHDPTWHHDYMPYSGTLRFLSKGEELFFGSQSHIVMSQLLVSMQAVGATGAIHMGAQFLKQHYKPWKEVSSPKIYLPKETWINHRNIFKALNIDLIDLPYYDSRQKCLNWEGLKSGIETLPRGSVILIQAVAHNPTGCDPSLDQWHELAQIFLTRQHFAFFDAAYLGLVSGSPDLDAQSIRIFSDACIPLILAGTFAKSFGLYGERAGILSVAVPNQEIKGRVRRQMTLLSRSETGCCPSFGAKIVEIILSDESIRDAWEHDLKNIAAELRRRRESLKNELHIIGTPGNWGFLTEQVGMFSCLDFTLSQLEFLRREHHLYIDRNSRISFAWYQAPGPWYGRHNPEQSVMRLWEDSKRNFSVKE